MGSCIAIAVRHRKHGNRKHPAEGPSGQGATPHGRVMVPDDYDHAFATLPSVAGHIVNDGGVGLRHLCDWVIPARDVDMGAFGCVVREPVPRTTAGPEAKCSSTFEISAPFFA